METVGSGSGLVLSRSRGEQIVIGNDIVITVVDIREDTVRLQVDAPRAIPVHRREIFEKIRAEMMSGVRHPQREDPLSVTPATIGLHSRVLELIQQEKVERALETTHTEVNDG
jgi:carbon storage regulator